MVRVVFKLRWNQGWTMLVFLSYDLLAFLIDSWSSSLSRLGETFAVALNVSKAFDRVCHKALLSKLPSYIFYPALCSFLSSFLSGRSIGAVVDGHCSNPKPNNSGVHQGSVLSPTLFLLFINDLLSMTNCPIHSYDDDTTLCHLEPLMYLHSFELRTQCVHKNG